jgi:hypothetical protein
MILDRYRRGVGALSELVRVLIAVPQVEARRRRLSLHRAVGTVRRGAARQVRSVEGRARLRRVIAMVDARMPGGPNCVRRSLLEIALDRGAAGEKVLAGFVSGGGPRSGHLWLESEQVPRRYDAVVTL